ncbi:carboxypeptidase-like regulatory domain-containing protein [Singulisphaera sp. Ch08]|uniref:Carboxypeptidase-like regulatory domain-containing protein n=1 Tax=Singulisphaera sp. Ch08 TaxID=3120278 RepID=A0AAU7C7F4_9BACT
MRPATSFRISALLVLVVVAGCSNTEVDRSERPVLEPVSGVVTLDGKPLAGAVVTFLNLDEQGTLTVGETDSEGAYRLSYLGAAGTATGPYRVAVSYLMGTEGQVIGLAQRSTIAPTAEVNTAKELLPPRYSDLGRTTLRATVPRGGSTFVFALEGPLLDPPAPTEADAAPAHLSPTPSS